MAEEGVAALSLSEVARRIGIRPPSLYKYFPSRLAIYDALFRQGYEQALAAFRHAARATEPGLPALAAGFDAVGRLHMDNHVLSQLAIWRPVPGFQPTPEAFASSVEFVGEVHTCVVAAVERGQLHPDAASPEGMALLSVLTSGAMSQQMANQPDATFDTGHFTRLTPRLLNLFALAYPPSPPRSKGHDHPPHQPAPGP
jgi:AcrR family transcriptional regulator